MKAQSLQVNLSGPCNAQCPFCISRMTWKTEKRGNELLLKHLDRALKFAVYHRVDSVMITGTGEPTMMMDDTLKVIDAASRSGIPSIEIQTNGAKLAENPELLDTMQALGLTAVAISVANPKSYKSAEIMFQEGSPEYKNFRYQDLIEQISDRGLMCRLSLNLTWGAFNYPINIPEEFNRWVDRLRDKGLHQLTLRELGVPEYDGLAEEGNTLAAKVKEWTLAFNMREEEIDVLRALIEQPQYLLRTLPFGMKVYEYRGLSVSLATCMTDNPNPDEIRSFILQPSGHIFHSWNYKGSILI